MTLNELLAVLYQTPEQLEFKQVIETIDAEFEYTASAFTNGTLHNAANENQGSCKVFAFAHQCGLSESNALALFAEHYRAVIADPEGTAHQNIRQFIAKGWKGISFQTKPLIKK